MEKESGMKTQRQQLLEARELLGDELQRAKEWLEKYDPSYFDDHNEMFRAIESPINVERFYSDDWKLYPMRETLRNRIITLERVEQTALQNI